MNDRMARAIREFHSADQACTDAIRAGIRANRGRASLEVVRDSLVRLSEASEELAMLYDELAKRAP